MDFKIAVLAGDGIGPEISIQGVERRVGCGRVSYVSHQYPYIDSWFCVG